MYLAVQDALGVVAKTPEDVLELVLLLALSRQPVEEVVQDDAPEDDDGHGVERSADDAPGVARVPVLVAVVLVQVQFEPGPYPSSREDSAGRAEGVGPQALGHLLGQVLAVIGAGLGGLVFQGALESRAAPVRVVFQAHLATVWRGQVLQGDVQVLRQQGLGEERKLQPEECADKANMVHIL